MSLRFATIPCAMVLLSLSAGAQPLPDPILYYPFDSVELPGGDFSGSGNGGDLLGGAVLGADAGGRTGTAGDRALDLGLFNNGAYVNVPTAATGGLDSLVTNDSVTLSFWTFGNEQQPQAQWGFRAGGPATDRVLGSHVPWNNSIFYFDVAGCCAVTQRINLAAVSPDDFMGRWNHYAFVKDTTSTAIYINGTLLVDSGINEMAPLTTINQFAVGASFGGGASYGGLYDDFAVFDVALTPEQITDIAGGEDIPGISLRGDFDESGAIDEDDFDVLAANLGAHLRRSIRHEDGDYDLNGRVTLHDFRAFKQDFPGAFAAATGVPEPASVILVALAIGAILPLSLRRSKRNK